MDVCSTRNLLHAQPDPDHIGRVQAARALVQELVKEYIVILFIVIVLYG